MIRNLQKIGRKFVRYLSEIDRKSVKTGLIHAFRASSHQKRIPHHLIDVIALNLVQIGQYRGRFVKKTAWANSIPVARHPMLSYTTQQDVWASQEGCEGDLRKAPGTNLSYKLECSMREGVVGASHPENPLDPTEIDARLKQF